MNERVYKTVNNGVYKAGFATTQEAYEEALYPLFDTLDWLDALLDGRQRSEEHTSELQSLMRISYAVFCLKKNKHITTNNYKQQGNDNTPDTQHNNERETESDKLKINNNET